MRAIFACALLLGSASPLYAGCERAEDFPDTPPQRAMLCVAGECEITEFSYFCSNTHGVQMGFANGWTFEAYDDGRKLAFNTKTSDLRDVGADQVTCTFSDGKSCDLPIHK